MTENAQTTDVEQSVAITGSPNSVTEVSFDVRDTHLQSPLLGTLLSLYVPVKYQERIEELLVLGQVSNIEMKNRWHEEPALKNYIKINGRLPHLTEIGDTTSGKLQIVGAYRQKNDGGKKFEKIRLSVPPGSGHEICLVDRKTIITIMNGDFGYAYLGNFYGTANVPAPVYVRHFGDFNTLGSGEAYMGGVFGPSGSGKSVIAATLIALWAHNPQMGILILDPQSEFSENTFASGTEFDFNFHDILKCTSNGRFDPLQHIIRLDQLCLEGTEMFVQVLNEKDFFSHLGLAPGKIIDACDHIIQFLNDLGENSWNTSMDWDTVQNIMLKPTNVNKKNKIKNKGQQPQDELESTPDEPFPTVFTREAATSYVTSSRDNKAYEFLQSWNAQSHNLSRIWNDTVALFSVKGPQNEPRITVRRVLEDTILNGQIRILDLNPVSINMSQHFKLYLMDFVFRRLRQISHIHYRSHKPGNALIVLDEAGRYIPQDAGDDDILRKLCRELTDSVKEMRKMRCGFLFITQTITEIQKEIFRNLHFRIYGVGLGVGADSNHISSKEGEDAFELYKSLPDPRLSRTFSFMVSGVLLALGSSGKPMVIEGFPSGQAILDANFHILKNNNTAFGEKLGEVVSQ